MPHSPSAAPALRQSLAQAGLRATPQRLAILGALRALRGHPTAEQVHQVVRPAQPQLSLGTVYKTLDALVAAGLTRRVAAAEGHARRYDADLSAHHHLVCSETQQILDYADPELDALLRDYFSRRALPGNFRIESVAVHVAGTLENEGTRG